MEDCKKRYLSYMTTINMIVLALTNGIFLHYVLVAFMHLQNADLSVALGGCPKADGNSQTANETNVSEMTVPTMDHSVQHAVDDENIYQA